MPVPAGAQIDTEATRAKILQAATELLYQRGVNAVGVKELAHSAGVSKLTIYRYFGSKDGLVRGMLDARSERIHDWLQNQLADIPEGRERVLALFDVLDAWYREEGFRGCAVINALTDLRARSGFVADIAARHLARYRELLESNLLAAGIAEPETLSAQLLVLIEGATILSAVEGGNAGGAARAAAETLLETALPDTVPETAG